MMRMSWMTVQRMSERSMRISEDHRELAFETESVVQDGQEEHADD